MAYQETPEEKQKRQAKEADNAAKGKAAEAKQDYEVFGSRGDAARKGMEEGRMDAMGNAYKKGGIMEHKHNVDHVKHHYGKDHDHMHEQEKVKQHSAGHKMHHEHVKAMCGGGMGYSKKAK